MRRILYVLMTVVLLTLVGCSRGLTGSYTALVHEDVFDLQVHDSSSFTLNYEFVVYSEDGEKSMGTYKGEGTYRKSNNFYIFEIVDGRSYVAVKASSDLLWYENEEELEKYKEDGIRFIRNK